MGFIQIYSFLKSHPLTRHQTGKAIIRFAIWQFKSRIFPRPHQVAFIHPSKLWAKNGWTGITGNIYTGLHEFEDMAFLLHLLRKEDHFADVGANMGSYSILASGVCGAKTTAFEPVKETFERLMDNVQLNALHELVHGVQAAVGNEKGFVHITSNQDTTNHITEGTELNTVKVPILKLDHTLPSCPVLMKIDVEGFELPVLQGASQTLSNSTLKALVIELNGSGTRYNFEEADIVSLLKDYGFSPYQYHPFTRELESMDRPGPFNTIFCRDLDWVKTRLRTAAPFSVLNQTI